MSTIEQMIRDKAYELGYAKCGIIPIQALDDYGKQIQERIQKVPLAEKFYERQKRFASIQQEYPWAKSIVVAVLHYGKYKVPEHLKGHIGKAYLFDSRADQRSIQNSLAMEQYLQELGLKTASNQKFGMIGLRLAAMKAGLGIIRKNNFFYTEFGSWVHLEAWLTDREMEWIETTNLPACPENCKRCVQACPSGSLSSPYTMSPLSCVSFLTTFGGRDLPKEPLCKTFGNWIYGCDACQDACPMNKGKWEETSDFPEVSDWSPHLTPEKIMEMKDDFYQQKIQPKFFYLTPKELWKWQVNVLCFMGNHYRESYKPYIITACQNENPKIREMAQWIWNEQYA